MRITPETGGQIVLETGPGQRETLTSSTLQSVGREDQPRELLLEVAGVLVRIAPAAGARVRERTLVGATWFLVVLSLLQAFPLTSSRNRRRAALASHGRWRSDARASADWGAATLLQLVCAIVSILLLVGINYHLFLAVHPQLAGNPRYLQAFLQATVLVGCLLTSACWFTWGGRAGLRLAAALAGAALALLLAAGWWLWDAASVPDSLWLRVLRGAPANARAEREVATLLIVGVAALVAAALWVVLPVLAARRRAHRRMPPWRWSDLWNVSERLLNSWTGVAVGAAVIGGGSVAGFRGGALLFHLVLLAVFAALAAVLWSRTRGEGVSDAQHRSAALRSVGAALVLGIAVAAFLLLEVRLTLVTSWVLFVTGVVGVVVVVGTSLWRERAQSMLAWWTALSGLGAVGSLVYDDIGSAAVWLPTILGGLYFWIVRPEEPGLRAYDQRRSTMHLVLAAASGLVLLGFLNVFSKLAEQTTGDDFARARQRVLLTRDVSYNTGGEWLTEVRWLVSDPERAFTWVGNLNSDLAIFGVGSTFGGAGALWEIGVSALLVSLAALLLWAADQALLEGRAAYATASSEVLPPALHDRPLAQRPYPAYALRCLGLFLGTVAFLLLMQWSVHVTTGVVLHLPITGLGLPWISHANNTHLLFTAALAFPLALLASLGEWTPTLAPRSHR